MGDTKEGNKISCHCGKCSFSLNQRKAVRSLLCGCEDCRQALEWGSTLGGKKPTGIERAVYVKSDISTVSGKESMRVVMLPCRRWSSAMLRLGFQFPVDLPVLPIFPIA